MGQRPHEFRMGEDCGSFEEAEQCDLVICLGDLIDREQEHAKEIVNLFLHQNIDPTIRSDHRLFNDREIRDILE